MNPILDRTADLPFDQVKIRDMVPATLAALREARRELKRVRDQKAPLTFANTFGRFDRALDGLQRACVPLNVFFVLKRSEGVRRANAQIEGSLTKFYTDVYFDTDLYSKLKKFARSKAAKRVTPLEKRFMQQTLTTFEEGGVKLSAEEKKTVATLLDRATQLATQYDENQLDCQKSFYLHLASEADLEGLSPHARQMARAAAQAQGLKGWAITLDEGLYFEFMENSLRRDLRRAVFEADISTAVGGEFSNLAVMDELLTIRRQVARLLGYRSYAAMALEDSMPGSLRAARRFCNKLLDAITPAMKAEFKKLEEFGRTEYGYDRLERWDVPFLREQLRRKEIGLDSNIVREYFPAEAVIDEIFRLANRLFRLSFHEKERKSWHDAVRFFEVWQGEEHLGNLYLDLYPRPQKEDGAMMIACITGGLDETGEREKHLGIVMANACPPVGDKPGLFSHRDVVTLFHEFGHFFHLMLSKVDFGSMGGLWVHEDWKELPSMMMENWAWEKDVLRTMGQHYETGEAMPDVMIDRIIKTRSFMEALNVHRQVSQALADLALHSDFSGTTSALDLAIATMEKRAPRKGWYSDGRFASFNHIFSWGYSAAYYSYKWAEMLDADAFSRFRDEGIYNRKTGQAFIDAVLSRGDDTDPENLFREFMGRDPVMGPLIERITGTTEAKPAGAAIRLVS